jgi:hypothetical protein
MIFKVNVGEIFKQRAAAQRKEGVATPQIFQASSRSSEQSFTTSSKRVSRRLEQTFSVTTIQTVCNIFVVFPTLCMFGTLSGLQMVFVVHRLP